MDRILIANRGEIACRLIRGVRAAGKTAIAIYSEADANALHVRLADEKIAIGPAPAKDSYLDGEKIVRAAVAARCDAIHPGYGFLAESAAFAGFCESHGVHFIGPRAETIGLMGTKTRAREAMAAAGVPVLPGSGDLAHVDEAVAASEATGFPAIIKAIAGGGGIGMKVVRSRDELARDFGPAQQRAAAVFKSPYVFLERFLERPRHVEVQVLGYGEEGAIHLFERECSIQRRHQKVVEESPAPCLEPGIRDDLLARAAAGTARIGYISAGTLEFLYDPRERAFWFMEMNTRLQVEHPVTEMTTGIDLVAEQLRIAECCHPPIAQRDVRRAGHAIELRVYAEDPARGFAPSPGKIAAARWPEGEGIRCDHGYESGDVVPPWYDPLLAKVIVHAESRPAALARARDALERTSVEGIRTNLALLRRIVADEAFGRGEYDTHYLADRKDLLA